jgi:hypothetical protein
MSIRGRIVYECDQKNCHGEWVMEADDAAEGLQTGRDISLTFTAFGWRRDADDELWCPQCVEDAERRDDSHERAAARSRNCDFADNPRHPGRDWT